MKGSIRSTLLALAGWACAVAPSPFEAAAEPASHDLVVRGGTPAGIAAAIATAITTGSIAKELPKPRLLNPGLRYYYPVPKEAAPKTHDFDIVIYGASPAAVSAACQAKKMGKSVGIFVFRRHVGGMSSAGLSDVDYGKKEAIGGMAKKVFLDFFEKQVQSPAEVETLFLTMLTDLDVPVFFEHRLQQVERQGDRITRVVFENGNAARGKVFIDATYEGDLMARAGVEHVAGRESNADFGEKLNGIQIGARSSPHNFQWKVDPYVEAGNPASGVIEGVDATPYTPEDHGKADKRYQPFCFRVFATKRDPIPWPRPADYKVARYELLKRYVNAAPRSEWWNLIYSRGPLKLNEGDCNAAGPVSLDFVGGSLRWVDASYAERERIFQDHVNYQKGYLYFLANDPSIPAEFRQRVSQFGLPKTEFPETGGWPHELYVREGRRLRGDYVLTEHDCLGKTVIEDSVGLGSFIMDSHIVRRIIYKTATDAHITHLRTSAPDEITEAQRNWTGDMVGVEGQFDSAVPKPYRISYRCLRPKKSDCINLLVPTVISSTHVAFGSSRMEPVFMILGQSAGAAASLAIDAAIPVQDVNYPKLREVLLEEGQLLD
ncbi:MAG: FAD-dependent oxidoreductase [Verrucomicrobiae bacterium]|nr:FAD-dependent oxidoreductase [Verrucomicrobiae bacterium]